MAAARGQATRWWLELRDAVLARWRAAFVVAQVVLLATTARADEPAAQQLTATGKSTALESVAAWLRVRFPRLAATAFETGEVIETPAFRLEPATEEPGHAALSEDGVAPQSAREVEPPASPAPALSLEAPARPGPMSPRPVESILGEEALLSPAIMEPMVCEEPAQLGYQRCIAPDLAQTAEAPPTTVDVLSLIRKEIKRRLPYFQSCARSARRRNGLEVRRLRATWAVAADGRIKDMKLDGIDDPELGACIVRVGSRPFEAHPGTDLVIPAPIVFVH